MHPNPGPASAQTLCIIEDWRCSSSRGETGGHDMQLEGSEREYFWDVMVIQVVMQRQCQRVLSLNTTSPGEWGDNKATVLALQSYLTLLSDPDPTLAWT
mmetsp:Transcript_111284/g.193096  ORF Transcript_111284/g.193096 Transcript_111284/m.193096 type:complete len:99 (-) Transcript_111284:386-682(-)